MSDLQIKTESFPERCEICHKADHFDPTRNWCGRCAETQLNAIHKEGLQRQPQQNIFGRFLCRFGLHKWHYLRWDRYCDRCGAAQHVWNFLNKTIEWKESLELEGESTILSHIILPLRQWRCLHCFGMVLSVHPPGYFEACPYCGKTDYVGRKRSFIKT